VARAGAVALGVAELLAEALVLPPQQRRGVLPAWGRAKEWSPGVDQRASACSHAQPPPPSPLPKDPEPPGAPDHCSGHSWVGQPPLPLTDRPPPPGAEGSPPLPIYRPPPPGGTEGSPVIHTRWEAGCRRPPIPMGVTGQAHGRERTDGNPARTHLSARAGPCPGSTNGNGRRCAHPPATGPVSSSARGREGVEVGERLPGEGEASRGTGPQHAGGDWRV